MKVKYVTADGCEKIEYREFEGDRPPAMWRCATVRRLNQFYPNLTPGDIVPMFYRDYDFFGIVSDIGAGGQLIDMAVYLERL